MESILFDFNDFWSYIFYKSQKYLKNLIGMEKMGWKIKSVLVLFCSFLILGSWGYLAFWYFFDYRTDYLSEVLSLRDYNFNASSVVLSDNGEIIDRFAVEDRVYAPFKDIPWVAVNAAVAAEDKNFFKRRRLHGVDLIGVARAAFKNMAAGKVVAGGSTITQQTAKNVFNLGNEKSYSRKFKEALIAYKMEKYLPKELIFEIYINLVYFGHGKYGIVTASEFYFSKKPSELTPDEAAMLAGLIKWPYKFSPVSNLKAAEKRRNVILQRMYSNRFIAADELGELRLKPLVINVKNSDPKAPYFSSFILDELHRLGYKKVVNQGLVIKTPINALIQEAAQVALQKGLSAYDERHKNRLVLYNIFSEYDSKSFEDFDPDSWHGDLGVGSVVDGLVLGVEVSKALVQIRREEYPEYVHLTQEAFFRIRKDIKDFTKVFKVGDVLSLLITGVDAERQFTAEIIQPEVQGAVAVIDVETGGIKAMVGGRDFKASQYNRAMQAGRQAGSAFKPFVYSAYFEKYPDKDLESHVLDAPICFKTGNPKKPKWCPKNYEETSLPAFMGSISVKTALARSRNVAAVRTANAVGINNVVDLAKAAGLTSEIPRYLPTAIGAADVKIIDMASAYSTIFRQGMFKPYWFINTIADRNGLTRNLEIKEESRALSAKAANKVLEGMRWVVLAGTARSAARELPFAVAGKTGTTNNFTDTWFIGGTPKYIIAVWVGFDRKAIPLASRESSFKETGGSTALPIFIEIMKEIYKNRPYDEFPKRD